MNFKQISSKINLIAFCLLLFLLILIPFQAFLLTWFKALGLSKNIYNLAVFWKEIILFILIISAILNFFANKKKISLLKTDKAILIFIGLNFLYALFFNLPLEQKIIGLRYGLEFLIFYLAVRFNNFNQNQFKILIFSFLGVSVLITIFGLMQISYLPPDFLEKFGYSRNLGEYLKTGIVPTYESVSPLLPSIYRVQSTFPGALQFGSYLVLIFSLFLSLTFYFKNKFRYLAIFNVLMIIWALYATHTRSSWISVLVAILTGTFLIVKNKKFFIGIALSIITACLVLISLFFSNKKVQTILLHGEIRDGQLFGSTQAHLEALINGLSLFIASPFGNGVGFAGPASKAVSDTIVTENWYLQIALETGIMGIIIFLLIMFFIFSGLFSIFKNTDNLFYKYIALGIFISLSSIVSNNLMLHTFADTATVYPLFIFIGMLFSLNSKQIN